MRETGLNNFTDWLVEWLTEWLADWLTCWLTDWLADWLTGWMTDWLTYSVEQNPSWEAKSSLASQESPLILWNPKVHYRVYMSLCWARSIQSTPKPTSWKSILILYTHVRPGLPSGLLPSDFPTNSLYKHLLSPTRAMWSAHPILLDLIPQIIFGEQYSPQQLYTLRYQSQN